MNSDSKKGIKRRDFLAGAAALSVAAVSLPLPLAADPAKMKRAAQDAEIVSVGIYPTIGVCRVGGADIGADGKQMIAAPEVPGVPPNPEGGFKVDNTSIKKQVQRFFIYGFDAEGNVVAELTHNDQVQINWTVRVANTKAAWYGFNNPFDLGESAPGLPAQLRNSSITGDEREEMLVIDSGPRTISRPDMNTDGTDGEYSLTGTFWGQKEPTDDYFGWAEAVDVNLGQLQTDEKGRLKVVPASGKSESVVPNNRIVDFTKNDAWYDDWCDGVVHATVFLEDGQALEARPAWVVCCGPNFAPEIPPFTTMYDRIQQTMVEKHGYDPRIGAKPPEEALSFSQDIYPIFHRLGLMKWVATAALLREGWIGVGDFSDPDYIRQLADNSASNAERRQQVFDAFRNPDPDLTDPHIVNEVQYKLPYMAGSGINYENSPKRYYMMPELQYSILERWRDGDFINDFDAIDTTERQNITSIDQLPLAEQPYALTKAALEPLSGGAFHPGVELTWVLERPELFDDEEPFRLAVVDREWLSANMGPLITPENTLPTPETKANQPYWPVGPQSPGDLTRWMGLPWQPDAFSCQNINFANDFPTLVWWPALLPVQVIPEYAYKQMLNPNLPTEVRLTFANTRAAWSRGVAGLGYHVNGSYFDGLNRMVYLWEQMGFVVKKEVPAELTDALGFDHIFVETERGSMDLQFHQTPNLGLKY